MEVRMIVENVYVSPHPKGSGTDIILDDGIIELYPPERDSEPAHIIWSDGKIRRHFNLSKEDTHVVNLAMGVAPVLADVCAAIVSNELEVE
jgi:hypothetical protein